MTTVPLRVFLIEDADSDARLVESWLGEAADAFVVERATTLAAGLAHLASVPCCAFDVLILDLGLPDSTGVATVERVIEAGVKLPIVLLSAADDIEIVTAALRAGAVDYLLKGKINGDRLRCIVRHVVTGHRASREVELTRRALEAMSITILLIEADGTIRAANSAAMASLGYSQGELIGRDMSSVAVDMSSEDRAARWAELRQGERVITRERLRRADGSIFPVEISSQVIERDGHLMEIAVAQDISERDRLEAKLVQADRLANVGLLAAGVVHEINNSLTFVMFNLEGLGDELPRLIDVVNRQYIALRDTVGQAAAVGIFAESGAAYLATQDAQKEVLERLEDAIEGAHRVRDIVRDLKTFSRVDDQRLDPISVNAALDVAAGMASNEVKYRARLVRSYGDVPYVVASEGRLAQVFLNLIINAAHAIPPGSPEHHEIRLSSWLEGERVVVEIGDTGEGIPPAILERIFEPFFSTKPPGVGSGLGLGICRDIVTSYQGDINVETELGAGTRVRVSLPITARQHGLTPVEIPVGGAEILPGRVLIVDDAASVREALARHLAVHHEVVTAASCAAARELLEDDAAFDLIICELMMPKVNGIDLHAWLQESHPDLAASMIFLTTGTLPPEFRVFLREMPNAHLTKPFTPRDVCAVAQEVLAARRRRR